MARPPMKEPLEFVVRQGDEEHVRFHELLDMNRFGADLLKAHPTYCTQCIYETAAEWFYLGWHAAKQAKE